MKISSIFEKVNLIIPLEQRRFFNYLEDTESELISKYGEKFVLEDGASACTHNNKIDGEINILPQYEKAIANNILYLAGAGELYISEYLRLAEQAYIYYYRKNTKKRRLKRRDY